MAIRVTGYTATGLVVWHDEGGHGGALTWAQLAATFRDGIALTVPCPQAGCGAVSVYPVAGGCDPDAMQELFVRVYLRLKQGGATDRAAAVALVRQAVAAMDGAGRAVVAQ